jgi:hypothetical protein
VWEPLALGLSFFLGGKSRVDDHHLVFLWKSFKSIRDNNHKSTQGRIQDRDKGGLNSEDLGIEVKINGDLRLSNCDLVKK